MSRSTQTKIETEALFEIVLIYVKFLIPKAVFETKLKRQNYVIVFYVLIPYSWLIPGKRAKCYKKNEAANVLWEDAVEEANCPQCKSIERFCPKKFNKDCKGDWRKKMEVDFGI